MKVVIAGGSGALGRRLCAFLHDRGHDIVVLTRNSRKRAGPHRLVHWDGRTIGDWAAELEGAAVINLAGELVDRRPSTANTGLLTESRVEPTKALARAAAELCSPVPVWVQASTLAIYGDAGERLLTEASTFADGPPQMAGVARAWEEAANGVNASRKTVLRTSIVLDRDTPALDRLLLLTRLGLGRRVASGKQWFSWIHIMDWLAIVDQVLCDPALEGTVLATAPTPVRNAELMTSLRSVLGRPAALPTPEVLVRLCAWVLRTDPALALSGRQAIPARLSQLNFNFVHSDLRESLEDLLSRP
ncbi:TIGR01777 family oxidoreductase [Arthrobacter sp. HLT1-21]